MNSGGNRVVYEAGECLFSLDSKGSGQRKILPRGAVCPRRLTPPPRCARWLCGLISGKCGTHVRRGSTFIRAREENSVYEEFIGIPWAGRKIFKAVFCDRMSSTSL